MTSLPQFAQDRCILNCKICRHAYSFVLDVQREGAAEDVLTGSLDKLASRDPEVLPMTDADTNAKSSNKHKRILRTYGQKKAKADSSADHATPTLSSDFLALVGGQR